MGEEFRAQPIYLLPIVSSLLVGLVCAYLVTLSPVPTYPVTPFPDTPSGSLSNALYFVVIIALSATMFYLLIKWKSRKTITVLVGFALTAASMLLSVFYLSAAISSVQNRELLIAALAIAITIVFDFIIFKIGGKLQNVVVVALGGALGVFLSYSIPLWSAVLILVFLAVYDVIAVYKGPVGKIASSGLDQLKGLSFDFKELQMGLGDLVFYSMLSSAMLFKIGLPSYLLSSTGILMGSFVTFLLLEKKHIFPGLPVPILLGLAGGFAGSVLPI